MELVHCFGHFLVVRIVLQIFVRGFINSSGQAFIISLGILSHPCALFRGSLLIASLTSPSIMAGTSSRSKFSGLVRKVVSPPKSALYSSKQYPHHPSQIFVGCARVCPCLLLMTVAFLLVE